MKIEDFGKVNRICSEIKYLDEEIDKIDKMASEIVKKNWDVNLKLSIFSDEKQIIENKEPGGFMGIFGRHIITTSENSEPQYERKLKYKLEENMEQGLSIRILGTMFEYYNQRKDVLISKLKKYDIEA